MEWTTKKPNKSGHYWFRDRERPGKCFMTYVVDDGYGLVVYGLDEFCRRLYEVHGEWAGPLPEPTDLTAMQEG